MSKLRISTKRATGQLGDCQTNLVFQTATRCSCAKKGGFFQCVFVTFGPLNHLLFFTDMGDMGDGHLLFRDFSGQKIGLRDAVDSFCIGQMRSKINDLMQVSAFFGKL